MAPYTGAASEYAQGFCFPFEQRPYVSERGPSNAPFYVRGLCPTKAFDRSGIMQCDCAAHFLLTVEVIATAPSDKKLAHTMLHKIGIVFSYNFYFLIQL